MRALGWAEVESSRVADECWVRACALEGWARSALGRGVDECAGGCGRVLGWVRA